VKRTQRLQMFWGIAPCIVALAAPGLFAQDAQPSYRSPVAVAADTAGATLYVAQTGAGSVAVFDSASSTVTREIPVPAPVTGLALAPDGRLYVTCGGAAGAVAVVAPGGGAVERTLPAGHTPTGLALHPNGNTLYVCNRFNNAVGVVDLAVGQQTAQIPVAREPVAAAVTPDGQWLVVANHLPAGPSDGDYTAAVISIIDTAANAEAARVPLPNGSTGLRGLCLSPDGRFAYTAHILARYHLPTTQLERGWMNTNALSIIDVAGKKLVNTVLLDSVDLGAANPWGVACSADGKFLCVAHAGTHEISVVDLVGLHSKLDRVAAGERVSEVSRAPEDVPNDLAFLVDLRRRLKLTGNGPRGIVLAGTKAYVTEYFTDSLGVVDIAPGARPAAASLPLGPAQEMTVVRKGEMFFHDAALCFQHWQSCASCHPDARVDGLNWDLMNDGLGNPKNTRSMLLSHETPPVMSLAVRDTAETAVRSGIRYIQFAVRPEEDAVAIDEYLKLLRPVASPVTLDDASRAAAERGAAVFERAGCAACHNGPNYTDQQPYDVGMTKGLDEGKPVDTPALIEAWRTAPYLYDGRAATMRDVLTTHNPNDRHGVTSTLTPEELADLEAFVLSR